MSSIASDRSRRSFRARLAACLLAAWSAGACGGEANKNGDSASGGVSGSGAGGQPAAGAGGAPTGGSTAAGSGGLGGTSGASNAGGGEPSAGATGDDWTLPSSSDKSWRNSGEPLCAPAGDGWPLDIWSDARGVYALARTTQLDETTLSFNDGSGWSSATPLPSGFSGLSGFRDGPLIVYSGSRCGVMFLDGDLVQNCVSALPGTANVFTVSGELAFAIAGNRVLHYNGSYFTQYGTPLPESFPVYGFKLWADAEVVIVAGETGLYVLSDATSEAEVIALPSADPPRSLWAFGRDDIWLGLEGNTLAHYDGSRWTLLQFGLDCGSVNGLWGSDGVLFVASSTFVGKVEGDAAVAFAEARRCPLTDSTMVGQHESLGVRKIWGNSPTEVFFAFTEEMSEVHFDGTTYSITARPRDACGVQRLYWSDGTRLRPL